MADIFITQGSAEITEVEFDDEIENNTQSTAQDLYITHNSANPLTNFQFYLEIETAYEGSSIAISDLDAMIDWAEDGYGLQLNMNNTGSFPSGSWVSISDVSNPTSLAKEAIAAPDTPSTNGIIPVGKTAHIKIRISVPPSETEASLKHIKLSYSYIEQV